MTLLNIEKVLETKNMTIKSDNLTPLQLDALKELGNIGTGNAGKTIELDLETGNLKIKKTQTATAQTLCTKVVNYINISN